MCLYEILYIYAHLYIYIFPDSSVGKEFACERPQFDSWVGKIPWRRDVLPTPVFLGFPCGSAGKESACKAGDLGSIPGLGRSPGEGKGYPLQFSGLENSMDNPWGRRVRHNWATFTFTSYIFPIYLSLPRWLSGKESTNQGRRCRFSHWVGKIFWRRKWQPTPGVLLEKSHGQKSLVGCSSYHCGKRVRCDLATKQQQAFCMH